MRTLIDEDLPMQVDCTAWFPGSEEVIAVGAYQLFPHTTDVRTGRLYLLLLTPSVPGGFSVVLEYEPPGGVLDLKFNQPEPEPASCVLAIATSTGLYLHTLSISPTPTLSPPLFSLTSPGMVLHLQFIPSPSALLYSTAEGAVGLLRCHDDQQYTSAGLKKLHDALTWICHYSNEQNIIYAGCDDGKFTAFRLEDMERDELHYVKKFRVGVTGVCSQAGVVGVGGYDDTLSLYTVNTTPKPALTLLTSINLGGAIWRCVFVPHLRSGPGSGPGKWMIAIAAARKGIKFVEYDLGENRLRVVLEEGKYEGSLAYGLDVIVKKTGDGYLVASGYFDSHVVHVWEWEGVVS